MMQTAHADHQPSAQKVIDPICGMPVDSARAAGGSTYDGAEYFFCSPGCKQKFDADPAKYVEPQPSAPSPQAAPATTEYTCPMHPEIRQPGPGSYPKCGMALEPAGVPTPAAEAGIAMGTGTDVAMESADVTLVKGDLRGIVRARRLSRATIRNIRQIFWAFVYNAAGVPVAAGILYSFFGILLSPMIAAAAMSLSSVSVIANALGLRMARI